ncbi:hypothetical protein BVY00_02615 [bacterium G20]|nr:hypothetical protein BVY00_02615 [bacterium G20]
MDNNGPTVFDINKPRTYGATPGSRPVISGHQPMMPDPMVTTPEPSSSNESKINVNVYDKPTTPHGEEGRIDASGLTSSLFGPPKTTNVEKPSGLSGGEPQPSTFFRPDDKSDSTSQRPPLKPVSDLSGINPVVGTSKASNDDQALANPSPSVYGNSTNSPITGPEPPRHRKSRAKFWLSTLFVLLLILAGVYAAIDKGLILSSVNLPFHIFKKAELTAAPAAANPAQPVIPPGFSATKLVEANAAFAYPTAWGAPTATTDPGFSKRVASAKSDVSYAFLINFPTNKDVQVAITSAKYLPPARAAQYYDFLGWCLGSADGNYYVSVLRYSTKDGTDSPSTVTCDQGPLNNVAKLNNDTIVQTNIKNGDGSLLGDIYTKNLSDKTYVVARVKDATMKNGDLIKTMLDTIKSQ